MVEINGTDITVTRGDTLDVLVGIFTPDGEAYPVRDGDVIRFALKRRYTDREALISRIIPHDTMNLRLESGETGALEAGGVHYVYDLRLTAEDGTVDTFIDRARLFVTEGVG